MKLSNNKTFYIQDIDNYNIEFLKEVVIDLYDKINKEEIETKVLTKEEAESKGLWVFSYDNGDYEYADENDIYHLIRNKQRIAKGLWVKSYLNRDYEYRDENYICHRFDKNGEKIE